MPNDSKLGGRLPLVDPKSLSAAQRSAYDFIVQKMVPWAESSDFTARLPDGRLVGPFNVFLSSPAMSEAFLEFQQVEGKRTTLDERTRQVVILAVGAVWQCDYERYAHAAVARKAGLSAESIDALVHGQTAPNLSEKEQVACELARAITSRHSVDDALYARAEAALGTQGIVDLLFLAGCYDIISSLLDTFRVPVPSSS